MFTMENCFYVLISQAVRCLKDPSILPRDKQRLKQELSSELVRRRAFSMLSNDEFSDIQFFLLTTINLSCLHVKPVSELGYPPWRGSDKYLEMMYSFGHAN